jgi:Ethanolamine utilization protein EutJ (predicted chaperonin)
VVWWDARLSPTNAPTVYSLARSRGEAVRNGRDTHTHWTTARSVGTRQGKAVGWGRVDRSAVDTGRSAYAADKSTGGTICLLIVSTEYWASRYE